MWWFGPEPDDDWLPSEEEFDAACADAQADPDFPIIDAGACCACGSRANVRNFILLPFKTPVPGTGWGCALCGLPADGAIAVVCDECAQKGGEIALRYMCVGFVSEQMRCEIEGGMEPFEHVPGIHASGFGGMEEIPMGSLGGKLYGNQ